MTNEYYNPSGSPSTGSTGSSATMRSEFTALQAGFALLPTLSGNGALPLFVNAGATALEATAASTARIRLGLGSIATQDANNVTITGGTVKTISALTTNNVAITGGTITGLSQLASNNVTITGGTISGVGLGTMSTQNANNVAIAGGTISTTGNVAFQDSTFTVIGSGDATKKMRIEVDGVSAGQTRVATMPDYDLTLGQVAVKIVLFTRDTGAASGTQAVTGVGFTPRAVVFMGGLTTGTGQLSVGMDDGTTPTSAFNNFNNTADTWGISATNSITFIQSGTAFYEGKVTAFGSDGFTVTWTKTGAPAGTNTIYALCFR